MSSSSISLRRTFTGTVATALIVGGSFAFVSVAGAEGPVEASVPPGAIALHNDTAGAEKDCPDDGFAYWHFVLAPNDDSSAFTEITLDLGTEVVTFSGDQIVPNGSQMDNVFVGVPAGHALTDLRTGSDSYAFYVGETPNLFNLSHVCEGTVPTTSSTSSSSTSSSSTSSSTSSSSTSSSSTSSTSSSTSSTSSTSTSSTSTPPSTDTQPTIPDEVLGTVQTPAPEAAAAVTATGQLPYTGSDTGAMVVSGAAVLVGGLMLAGLARTKGRTERS